MREAYVDRGGLATAYPAALQLAPAWKISCHCCGARGWMKLGAAPSADVARPWRCVPVWKTDAGACPVGTPDCCYERVSQDLDLVLAPRAARPYPVSGAEAGGGDGYRPSARRRDRRAQEGGLGRGAGAGSA